MKNGFVNLITVLLMFFLFFVFSVGAQAGKEYRVQKLRGYGDKGYGCFVDKDVVTKEALEKITADKNCAATLKALKVDFENETLLSFHENGDCALRVSSDVFRNDSARKIIVKIKNYDGGCRAGGSFQGWLVIEKIPPDYIVEFTRQLMGKYGERDGDEELVKSIPLPAARMYTLQTREVDLKGCIQLIRPQQLIIKSRDTFLKAVRNDAGRDSCLKDLEPIDFTKYSMFGINLNTGYCRIPSGLEFHTAKDEVNKQYLINISYLDPRGSVCRAMSSYDLWLLVPKLPEDYEAKFDVKAVLPETR